MTDVTTGSSTIAALFPSEVISKQVAESLQAKVTIAPYVWIETEENSTVIKFGILPALTAAAYTDTTGMPLVAFSPTSNSVTAAPAGVTVRITGIAQTLRPSAVFEAANEEGKAIGAKIDTDLAALFASFTGSVGSTGTAMTAATFLAAIAVLNKAKVPSEDRVCILGATGYSDLLGNTQTVNAFAFQQAALSGQVPVLYGVPVEMTQVLATANSAADNVGGLFNRRALGLGLVKVPTSKVQDAPAQYDGVDIASKVYYGCAIIDAVRGCKIISKV